MMTGCDGCSVYSNKEFQRYDGEDLCEKCVVARKMEKYSGEDIFHCFDIGDDVGALNVVLNEPFETTIHTPSRNGPYDSTEYRRRPGIYLPEKEARNGTPVQNSELLMNYVAGKLIEVARGVEKSGYEVTGVGKNHDNSICVFIDNSEFDERDPWFSGKEYVDGTQFKSCTIMGWRQHWVKHYEPTPSVFFYPNQSVDATLEDHKAEALA